ncbi:hypothetical protein ACFV27_00785 [Streptomyces antimycoticus]|uniref:hypothetical protein n=1 Tax=Streptomyces antimycoticus TaxID=68175 RepID=UPI003695B123
MTATKTRKTIEKLRTLIDHPRTGANEREAARRMLARVLAKAQEQGEKIAGDTATTGSTARSTTRCATSAWWRSPRSCALTSSWR